MTRHEVRGQQAVLGWGGKPRDSIFFTEPSDHSVLLNTVPQSTEMEWSWGMGLSCIKTSLAKICS